MDEIIEIEGAELVVLLEMFRSREEDIRKLSFAIDGGLKVKVNELMWTHSFGTEREQG